jgi:NAD+ diphosphatase
LEIRSKDTTPIHFVQDGYDRCTTLRRRQHDLKQSIENGKAILLFVYDGKAAAVRKNGGFEAGLVTSKDIPRRTLRELHTVFLGEQRGVPVFAAMTDENPRELHGFGAHALLFMDLAKVSDKMPHRHASLMSYAQAMDYWHRTHMFCGTCGCETMSRDSGHMRVCSNSQCERTLFPRTNPAVTVLVRSKEACLLGHQRGTAKNQFSTIAGFVEPGESSEQAAYREVYEKTSTIVRKVRYQASQPWPFPGALMLGYTATADTGLVNLKHHEMDDAIWVSREEMGKMVKKGTLVLPRPVSLSYKLIENWFNHGSSTSLRELV